MSVQIKNKIFGGIVWTGLERFANQAAGFIIGIVLARLLTPSDYGVIGIMNVFIGIAGLFIDCGLSTALIQKKNRNDEDYSTVFWCNLFMSILCYVIIFLFSPWISRYYKMPELRIMLRVLSLVMIFNSLYSIQSTKMTAEVNFRTQAKISCTSCIFSGAFGIWMATLGLGPWALVLQSVFATVYRTVCYWIISKWRPLLSFSKKSFLSLFSFSSKLFISSLLDTVYNNISPMIIGKRYSPADLGIYTKGYNLVSLPNGVFQSTFGRVIFPILSQIQDDEKRLKEVYRKYLRIVTSIAIPCMLIFVAVSSPLIQTIYGDKWILCVPYIRLLSLGALTTPIICVNLNILYVKGRSDIVLKLEIIKKIIAISIVVFSIHFSVLSLCIGIVFYSYIALFINLHATGPFIGMTFWQQIKDVGIYYISSIVSAIAAFSASWIYSRFATNMSWLNHFTNLIVSCFTGAFLYLIFAFFFKFEIIDEICDRLHLTKK